MNNNGTRRANGEGSIYNTIQKIDRKEKRLNFICDICKNCNDWSICNNRQGTSKCQKCLECTECLKNNFCDRFYCYNRVNAQITIDNKQHTVASKTNRKDTVAEKRKKEADVENGTYVKKSNKTLYHFCKQVEKEKQNANLIISATVNRNKYAFQKLQNASFYEKSIQKTTKEEIDNFINSYTYLSQSEIDKLVNFVQARI